ncbi:hypothetical protein N9948_00605 [bacterium]|nr:hypothetical protein [bacterium]
MNEINNTYTESEVDQKWYSSLGYQDDTSRESWLCPNCLEELNNFMDTCESNKCSEKINPKK